MAGFLAFATTFPAAASEPAPPQVSSNIPVTAENLINRTVSNSPVLAVDPTESRFVVLANRLDGPDFGCALQLSGDSGRSWISASPVPKLPRGAEKCYAPEVAFDREGRLYYLFLGLHGKGNSPMGAFLTTSDDRGKTFTPARKVLGPKRYQVRMAIDRRPAGGDRIHIVWLQAGSDPPLGGLPIADNPIMAAFSEDGGQSFSKPVRVSDVRRKRAVAPALALGRDGRVHVLYYDLRDDARDYQGLEGPAWEGTWSLVAATSADRGKRFGPGVVVDDQIVPPERVMLIFTMPPASIVSDPAGRLYAAWHDARNGDWDVFARRSLDGGRTWKRAVRLNDDPMHNGLHQYMPRLSAAPNGRIDAIFYDRRGNKENRGNDLYYTSSLDQGATFAPNVKVTTLDSDSKIGPRYEVPSAMNLNEFGGRIALWSGRSRAIAAWTDTRNTGKGFPAQDIFAALIRVQEEATASKKGPGGSDGR